MTEFLSLECNRCGNVQSRPELESANGDGWSELRDTFENAVEPEQKVIHLCALCTTDFKNKFMRMK